MSDLSRGELGIQMLCAWNNIPRDKAPASWSEHHNEWTRDAWARVAEAAIRHHAANSDGGVEPVAYWAVQTEFGTLVGLWADRDIAMRNWQEFPNRKLTPLYAHSPAKSLGGIAVTTLEWGEVEKPNQIVSYDHVHAPSSIGGYLVTWKSWKSYPSFTVERDGDFIETASSLEDAKAAAQADFDQRIRAALK